MIKYLDQTKQDCLTWQSTRDAVAKFFVDTMFALRPNKKS